MKRIPQALCAFIALSLLFSSVALGKPFKMPKRGAPVPYAEAQYPLEQWKGKSKSDFPWFVSVPGGWYWDLDVERQPLRYVVVHHVPSNCITPKTKTEKKVYEACISELEKKRLYEPVFKLEKYYTPYFFGLPVSSGHWIEGTGETFIPYHHLIYPDGSVSTPLVPYRQRPDGIYEVDMVGWHAGKWSINTQSVAVGLVGDYENGRPTEAALKTLDKMLGYYSRLVPGIWLTTHRDVRPWKNGKPTTLCPGAWWHEWFKGFMRGDHKVAALLLYFRHAHSGGYRRRLSSSRLCVLCVYVAYTGAADV